MKNKYVALIWFVINMLMMYPLFYISSNEGWIYQATGTIILFFVLISLGALLVFSIKKFESGEMNDKYTGVFE